MRLQKLESQSQKYKELNDSNNWILQIGNGTIKHVYPLIMTQM